MTYLRRKKKAPNKVPPTVLMDDREKIPWNVPNIYKVESKRLKTGDYTFKGYEHLCAIEKKANWKEFLTDISGTNRMWFEKQCNKLSKMKYKCIVIEASMHHLKAELSSIKKARLTEDSVFFWLAKIQMQYGIPIYLIGKGGFRKKYILEWLFKSMADCLEGEKPQ